MKPWKLVSIFVTVLFASVASAAYIAYQNGVDEGFQIYHSTCVKGATITNLVDNTTIVCQQFKRDMI